MGGTDAMEHKEAELQMLRKRLHDTRCRLREAKARAKDLEEQVEYLERAREIHPALALNLARGGIENTLRADTERAQALLKLTECEMWLGRCTPRETAAPAHGEAAAVAAQRTYVDVRPALDAALASWDPMEDVRRLMLRSAVD